MKAACGHVFKYGDNVDTDVIIPARYSEFFRPGRNLQHTVWRTLTRTL